MAVLRASLLFTRWRWLIDSETGLSTQFQEQIMGIVAINARNQFKGRIKDIVTGPVVSEVVVETPFGEVASVVTSRSINELDLRVGSDVVAMVKATEVSLAKMNQA